MSIEPRNLFFCNCEALLRVRTLVLVSRIRLPQHQVLQRHAEEQVRSGNLGKGAEGNPLFIFEVGVRGQVSPHLSTPRM